MASLTLQVRDGQPSVDVSSDTQLPDNGGVAGNAYLAAQPFGLQLTGPFAPGARTGFPPLTGSLDVATKVTLPDHGL